MTQEQWELPPSVWQGIDRGGPLPVYQQLAGALERAIRDEVLPAGARLENEVALSDRLGISRPTVRRAIQDLVDKGLLVRRPGVGTTVVHGRVMRGAELTSLHADLERMGQHPSTTLLGHEVVAANDGQSVGLGIEVGTPVLHLRRIRLAEGTPIALLDNVMAPDLADLDVGVLEERSLYSLLQDRGVAVRVARQRISARTATAAEGRLLGVRSGTALLTADRTGFDAVGRAVEFGQHLYLADRYSFEVTLVSR